MTALASRGQKWKKIIYYRSPYPFWETMFWVWPGDEQIGGQKRGEGGWIHCDDGISGRLLMTARSHSSPCADCIIALNIVCPFVLVWGPGRRHWSKDSSSSSLFGKWSQKILMWKKQVQSHLRADHRLQSHLIWGVRALEGLLAESRGRGITSLALRACSRHRQGQLPADSWMWGWRVLK